MSIFLGVHKFPAGEESREDVSKNWENYKQAAASMGLKPLRALVSVENGTAYCQTEAATADQVREAHDRAKIPFEEVMEVESLE